MIRNIGFIGRENFYTCNRFVAKWLVYKKAIPLLGRNNSLWYFAKNDNLLYALGSMPFYMRILSVLP